MAAQARIVLFSLGFDPGSNTARLAAPRTVEMDHPASQARYGPGSRRWGAGAIGWRVIGANNRELGRGALPAGSVDEACQAVRAAQLTFGRRVARVMLDAGAFWSWHISLDGDPVAVSSRGTTDSASATTASNSSAPSFRQRRWSGGPRTDLPRRAAGYSPFRPSRASLSSGPT